MRSARAATLLLCALVASAVLAGCMSVAPDPDALTDRHGRAGQRGPVVVTTAEQLWPAFSELVARTEPELAIAWAPIGRPDAVQVLGSTDTLDAWSTIKVPIGLAALQAAEGSLPAAAKQDVTDSLTRSDNNSAIRLFRGLSEQGEPALVVDGVLAANGDPNTRVNAKAFGLTQWSMPDSARFAAMLPCAAHADEVLQVMGGVVADQRWGLGKLEHSAYKGGWGASADGYVVRQIGVMRHDLGGGVGVSLLAQPRDGRHATATAALDEAAVWLSQQLTPEDSGACPVATDAGTPSP